MSGSGVRASLQDQLAALLILTNQATKAMRAIKTINKAALKSRGLKTPETAR